jgi:Tol biopolymer transport system component
VESAHARRLTTCGRGCFDIDPAWSPDQSEIAFTRVMEKEWAGEVERVSVRRPHLTSLAIYGRNPAWARDGKAIHVATLEGIVRVGANGSQTLLTAPRQRGDDPPQWASWSPAGSRVVYLSMQHRFSRRYGTYVYRTGVWTMSPHGAGKKRLYDGPCCVATPPIWSGDGTRVAFSTFDPSHKGNRAGTFVVNADGRQLRSLTPVTAEQLAWQPTDHRAQRRHR